MNPNNQYDDDDDDDNRSAVPTTTDADSTDRSYLFRSHLLEYGGTVADRNTYDNMTTIDADHSADRIGVDRLIDVVVFLIVDVVVIDFKIKNPN